VDVSFPYHYKNYHQHHPVNTTGTTPYYSYSPPNATSSNEHFNAVRDAFQFAWNGYATHAFPHDELHPVNKAPGSSRNDLGATAISAFGTAILMETPEVVEMIIDSVPTIDFNYRKPGISLFETNI
jgi:mannosyl-oligosaccharide alpha-1,2-mannosidase